MRSLSVVVASLAIGCSSKGSSGSAAAVGSAGSGPASRPLPAMPADAHASIRADGSGAIVTDELSGLSFRLTAVPDAIDAESGSAASDPKSVNVTMPVHGGFLMLAFKHATVAATNTPAERTAFFAGIDASLVGADIGGGKVTDLKMTPVTLTGRDAGHFTATLAHGNKSGRLYETVIDVPEASTVASTMLVLGPEASSWTDDAARAVTDAFSSAR